MTHHKYAMLLTNWTLTDGVGSEVAVDGSTRCTRWSLRSIDSVESRNSWREAFGSFHWDSLGSKRQCVIATGEDVTATTNRVNENLLRRVRLASYAFLLNRPRYNSGGVLTMVGGDSSSNGEPLTIKSLELSPHFYNPYFSHRELFEPDHGAAIAGEWIQGWCSDLRGLEAGRTENFLISPPVDMAILSFLDACTNSVIDFRIASLVRSVEALIAVPPGPGPRPVFVQRAMQFSPYWSADPGFVGSGKKADEVLDELYRLRSDVVHGKWPLRLMKDSGREDDVAVLEFVAEMTARAAIKWAIAQRVGLASYQSRESLETAWRTGSVPKA